MKKITYQITLSDNDYLECINKLEKIILFPAYGNMVFKVEEIEEDGSRAIIVNGVMYDSCEDYQKVMAIKERNKLANHTEPKIGGNKLSNHTELLK